MGGNFLLTTTTQDPGPACRCDLTLTAPISITAVGCSLMNDGQVIAGIPTPNLVGVPGGRIEMWVLPGGTVTNTANYTIPYTRAPAAGPDTAIGWTLAGVGSLAIQPLGVASMATFAAPVNLAAGTYAVELVLVAPYALPAGTDSRRCLPRMTSIPVSGGSLTYVDQVMTIAHSGTADPAFSPGALNHLTPAPNGPFLADIRFDYNVGPIAYSTKYGAGCYDRKKTFYESFRGAAAPSGSAPGVAAAGGIAMQLFGTPANQYLVLQNSAGFPLNGVTPGSTSYYTNRAAGTPTQVNSIAPAVGGPSWDDANSVLYPLPFPLHHPGGNATQISIGSNGVVFLDSTAGARLFYDSFGAWLSGAASFAVGFGDFWPADGTGATPGGTGNIFIDSDGATFVTVSWVNVQEFPFTPNFTSGNSFQVRFEASGTVTYAYGSLRNSDVAPVLIGYTEGNSHGHQAPDPGAGQTSPRAAVPQPLGGLGSFLGGLPTLSGDGSKPPSIRLANRPKHGAHLVLAVDDLDPSVRVVLTLLSLTSFAPGVALGPSLGMPGCSAFVLAPVLADQIDLTLGAPSASIDLGVIPPVGPLDVFAQEACFSNAPVPFNAPNILVSDAVCIHIDAN